MVLRNASSTRWSAFLLTRREKRQRTSSAPSPLARRIDKPLLRDIAAAAAVAATTAAAAAAKTTFRSFTPRRKSRRSRFSRSDDRSAIRMVVTCWVLVGMLATVVLLYGLIELHYFLRMFLTVFLARYCKKRVHILDETVVYAICTTTDVDALLYHMNNARYLRELDFARADFYERTDLYREVCSQGSGVVQGAATIRYRRFIKPLTIFKITSKIIYWDERSFFMEHRFITPSDGFVRAIAICRQRLLDCSADTVIGALLNRRVKQNGNVEAGVTQVSSIRPEMPPEVNRWMESNEISSAMLRQVPITTTSATTTTMANTISMTTHC